MMVLEILESPEACGACFENFHTLRIGGTNRGRLHKSTRLATVSSTIMMSTSTYHIARTHHIQPFSFLLA